MDVLVEHVHFDERLSPEDVGFKAVAVSVSDLAAMGATPRWLLLGLSVPGPGAFVDGVTAGVAEAVAQFDLELVGGDTTRSRGGAVVTSVVGGTCESPLLRSTAKVGDDLWVTGALGAAGLGWSSDDPPPSALQALRRPTPPVAFAQELVRSGWASAGMDLSDGLADDLERLCAASTCGAIVQARALPLAQHATLATATRGGEDYQLLFTASPGHRAAIEALATKRKVAASKIGVLTPGTHVLLEPGPWPERLFAHFQDLP